MPQVFTVSDVNGYIKGLLSYDGVLSSIWVRGEISNYKRHYSGHLYFTIKDAGSTLKCVMFKTSADKLLFEPENGMKVLIRGNISVFERDGIYQLYAENMKVDGIGDLHVAFEQLKNKLQSEGLFDISSKKTLPYMPKVVGVITSETGSVIKDILNVLTRRFYQIEVKLLPCPVQGEGAGEKLAAGVRFLNKNNCCDVIIIARGGGSIEDLWPFNEEILARAIAASSIPVISGVGHETDFTICDFVSDLRAPTPSAAAELVVPQMSQVSSELRQISERISNIPYTNLEIKKRQLDNIRSRTFFKKPYEFVEDERLRLSSMLEDLTDLTEETIKDAQNKNSLMAARLDALSPLKILARGYGAVVDSSGEVIRSIKDININDSVSVFMNDGILDCNVEEKRSTIYGK